MINFNTLHTILSQPMCYFNTFLPFYSQTGLKPKRPIFPEPIKLAGQTYEHVPNHSLPCNSCGVKKWLAWETFACVWTSVERFQSTKLYLTLIAVLYPSLSYYVKYIIALWNRSKEDFCSFINLCFQVGVGLMKNDYSK